MTDFYNKHFASSARDLAVVYHTFGLLANLAALYDTGLSMREHLRRYEGRKVSAFDRYGSKCSQVYFTARKPSRQALWAEAAEIKNSVRLLEAMSLRHQRAYERKLRKSADYHARVGVDIRLKHLKAAHDYARDSMDYYLLAASLDYQNKTIEALFDCIRADVPGLFDFDVCAYAADEPQPHVPAFALEKIIPGKDGSETYRKSDCGSHAADRL